MILKKSISFIGMAGCGKSTIGKIVSQKYDLSFCDTDELIEKKYNASMEDIKINFGYKFIREAEEEVIMGLDNKYKVISTGGSAVYSDRAIKHLKQFSLLIFIDASFSDIKKRIGDASGRGFAVPKSFSVEEAYSERLPLYKKYQDKTINGSESIGKIINQIEAILF